MSPHRPYQPWVWISILALLAPAWLGCGSEGGSAGDALNPPGTTDSSGGGSGSEGAGGAGGAGGGAAPNFGGAPAAFSDNPVDQLFADPFRNPADALGVSTDAGSAGLYADAAGACYGSADGCGAPDCAAFASCCVNSGTCCEPIVDGPALPAQIDFRSCAGQTVAGCAAAAGSIATAFGERTPLLTSRGLVPNGTGTAEGGAEIGEPVNLSSERVEIALWLTLPIGCNGTCLESAGVAFTHSAPGTFVDAEVGLLLSGSREVVNLMIGNTVADSFEAGTDNTRWGLVLSPDGSARVTRDGTLLGVYTFDAGALGGARFVVFGRNLGAAATSAAIGRIDVQTSSCDNARSWMERQPVSISFGGSALPDHALGRAPSIADDGVTRRLAYELGGEIFVAEEAGTGDFFLASPSPALVPTEPFEAQGLGDPELASDGAALFLFYTARDPNGAGRIGAAVSTQASPAFTKQAAPVLSPTGDVVSYDAPTALYRDGLWLLIVRAILSTGATELQAFYGSDLDSGWERIVNGGLEALTHVEEPTSELGEPSLIIHRSAYQLYYARRSGTRWAVELAVSDELLLWRPLGEALAGSDTGFDRIGARSPDAISGQDRIDMVYAGQDGVSFRLGTAFRTAPSASVPTFF